MNKMHAIVIEQSLKNSDLLKNFRIIDSKKSGNWDLDIIEIESLENAIKILQNELVEDEPYYFHIYNHGTILVVVFKQKVFRLDPTDVATWKPAQEYGAKLLNIPPEQLDFFPASISDESIWLKE